MLNLILAPQPPKEALAPAGYGKSSVLSQWFHTLQDEDAALGWLSLDRTQDDLNDFVLYMVAAVQVARPEFGKRLGELINSGEQPSVADVTASFANVTQHLPSGSSFVMHKTSLIMIN